jgi:hypothetical protein
MLTVLRAKERRENDAVISRLKQLAPKIYQSPGFCGQCGEQMALTPGPTENNAANDLLSNVELLQHYGILG